jgi:ribosomal protein S12 methylthiotransferase
VTGELAGGACLLPDPDSIPIGPIMAREREQSHTAYLKIAEGCSRHCTYCIIPGCGAARKAGPLMQSWTKPGLIAAGSRS